VRHWFSWCTLDYGNDEVSAWKIACLGYVRATVSKGSSVTPPLQRFTEYSRRVGSRYLSDTLLGYFKLQGRKM